MAKSGGGGGGGVAIMAGTVTCVDDSTCSNNTNTFLLKSPILVFSLFHKAISSELRSLHRATLDFVSNHHDTPSYLKSLFQRCHFLRSLYKHHCNAEDQVILLALDNRVKNVARTYLLEHEGEGLLFDQLFKLLNSNLLKEEGYRRELASCTGALRTSISQHMFKEEEQVFPLVIEKFSSEEQGSLVWQFLCSMPVKMMAEFLPCLASYISSDEYQDLLRCLCTIIPKEKLFHQVVFGWMEGLKVKCRNCTHNTKVQYQEVGTSNLRSHNQKVYCNSGPSKTVKRKWVELNEDPTNSTMSCPLDELLLWHKAIKQELNDLAETARKLQLSEEFSDLSSFNRRLQFITEVCIFHRFFHLHESYLATKGNENYFMKACA